MGRSAGTIVVDRVETASNCFAASGEDECTYTETRLGVASRKDRLETARGSGEVPHLAFRDHYHCVRTLKGVDTGVILIALTEIPHGPHRTRRAYA